MICYSSSKKGFWVSDLIIYLRVMILAQFFFQIRCKIRDLITVKSLPNVGIMTQTPTQKQVQNQVLSQNELQVRLSRLRLFCDVRGEVF